MRAGYAQTEITPPLGVELCGYGFFLNRKALAVHDPLFVRAVALESENGVRALLMSCDLIGLDAKTVGLAKDLLRESAAIPPEAVLVHCTHTHSGPATAPLRGCGDRDDEYVSTLPDKLLAAGLAALGDTKEIVRLGYSESAVDGIAFNRTCEDGPLDPHVRALFIHRNGEKPLVIVNYACHPVANGINAEVSADYPGALVSGLAGRGYQSIFFTGFCGDIDPFPNTGRCYGIAESHGHKLADTVAAMEEESWSPDDASISFGIRQVTVPYEIPSRETVLEELESASLEDYGIRNYSDFMKAWSADAIVEAGKPDVRRGVDACLQYVAVGDTVFAAFPGEAFTDIGLDLRRSFPELRLMTVNTSNGLIGYIPTRDDYDQKGYASHLTPKIFGEFAFTKGFGEQLRAEAERLLSEAGR